MATRIRLIGMTELRQQLTGLPAHLGARARPIVDAAADGAVRDVARAYPRITGTLAGGMTSQVTESDPARYTVQVRNTVYYAPMFEFGTRYMTGRPTFVPITRDARRHLAAALIDLVESEGLTVTGGASS
jgi:hypothetical protein